MTSNPLVKKYENSTEYTKILNKQKVMSPEMCRPKPKISKARSNAIHKSSNVQTKEENNASKVCNNHFVWIILFCMLCTYIFSFVLCRK